MKKITLTRHANKQLVKRGISKATILAVIVNGKTAEAKQRAISYSAWNYVVIVSQNRIVTAYETKEPETRKRRKKIVGRKKNRRKRKNL